MRGIILVNKPKDYTSRDVVNVLTKKFNTKRIGHTGTLDPLATGVLVICIGEYTKLVDLITNYNKEYIAELVLGIETDTLDITGITTKIDDKKINITKEQVIEVLNSFKGISVQEVPKYSAIKINGKKLYEYARENIDIDLPTREINISDIEFIDYSNNEIKFKCTVSKGTYIRSLIRDIGYKLNTYATMKNLVRTKQGRFNIEDSYTLEEITDDKYKFIDINNYIDLPIIKVDKDLELKIRNGAVLDKFFDEEKVIIHNNDNEMIAIYQIYDKDNTKVKPYRIFN